MCCVTRRTDPHNAGQGAGSPTVKMLLHSTATGTQHCVKYMKDAHFLMGETGLNEVLKCHIIIDLYVNRSTTELCVVFNKTGWLLTHFLRGEIGLNGVLKC